MTQETQIPDAAVQAALKNWYKAFDADEDDIIDMRAALTAALPHLALGFEVKQWGKVRETLAYCDTMFRLDLYKFIEWNGDDFNQAIFDTHERVKQALSIMEDISFIAATVTNVGTNPVDVAAVREAEEVIERNGEETTAATMISVIADFLRTNGKAVLLSENSFGKQILEFKLAADNLRAISAEPVQGEQWQPTHRHVKRGTEYQLIGTGKMQAETWVDGRTIKPTHPEEGKIQITSKQVDMQEVAIYRGDDGQLWARPIAEFNDGRFETLPAAPPSEAEA